MAQDVLVRVQRWDGQDRNLLLKAGVPLVADLGTCFLALGDEEEIMKRLASMGRKGTALATHESGAQYMLVVPPPHMVISALETCGQVIWCEEEWVLLGMASREIPRCPELWQLMVSPLTMHPLKPIFPPPERFAALASGKRQLLTVDPLVQQMVDDTTQTLVMEHWSDIVNVSTTRYSSSEGCEDAADFVFDLFENLGLQAEYQDYSSSRAPNVIGALPGVVHPDQIYIVVGHLDDLPSSGLAPGADDNASGSATVTLLADVMSQYRFEYTVRFIVVTGEEQGLLGSDAYATMAAQRGDQILGVLNADMTAWEGNGDPIPEDLDLNYNDASEWLGILFAQAATDYGTGCVVDAFSCPSLTASDHASFWAQGYPAVCGITDNHGYCGHSGTYPNYHQSSDTIANCGDPAFFVGTVRAYLATLAHLAKPLCRLPEEAPANLQAAAATDNQVDLSWTADGQAASFEIWRGPGACPEPHAWHLVGETDATSYSDTAVSGMVPQAYQVVARDATGHCASAPSDCVPVTATGTCTEAPVFEGVQAVWDQHTAHCGLEVSWNEALGFCGTDVVYNVYRAETPDVPLDAAHLVASCVQGLSFLDENIEPRLPYYYVVTAEDDSGNGSGPCHHGNQWPLQHSEMGVATGPITTLLQDDFESGPFAWVMESGPGDPGGRDPWQVTDSASHSPTHAAFCEDEDGTKDQVMRLATPLNLPAYSAPTLTFWHQYDFESNWDGGVLEYSVDGGLSWHDILAGDGQSIPTNGARFLKGGYNDALRDSVNPLSQRQAWAHQSVGFEQVGVDLTQIAGHQLLLRFRLGCDSSVGAQGWTVDDVHVTFGSDCEGGVALCDQPDLLTRWPADVDLFQLIGCLAP